MGDIMAVGRTVYVPLSLLELQMSTRIKAAQADNAGIDLEPWALDNEASEVSDALQVMRGFNMK